MPRTKEMESGPNHLNSIYILVYILIPSAIFTLCSTLNTCTSKVGKVENIFVPIKFLCSFLIMDLTLFIASAYNPF